MKDAVYELVANGKMACFVSQGTGVKVSAALNNCNIVQKKKVPSFMVIFVQVYEWSGVQKHINFNKYARSLAIAGTSLYCGCSGYSIQVNQNMLFAL